MIRSAATSCACWSRSLRGNVDRNALRPLILSANSCRSLRGNVDRNRTEEEHHSGFQGRSLRGNVDRNVSVLGHAFTSTSVVPYVGTWIEIVLLASPAVYSLVVPYVGTWIEISNSKLPPPCFCGRSLRGNVDRNYRHCSDKCNRNGRSLRGNVDRNIEDEETREEAKVVPYVGTWIEIYASFRNHHNSKSFPTWERG